MKQRLKKHKLNLYCIKCLQFINSNNTKTNREIDRKTNLYSHCIDCGFKKFEIIDEEEISGFINMSKLYIKQRHCIVWVVEKNSKKKFKGCKDK